MKNILFTILMVYGSLSYGITFNVTNSFELKDALSNAAALTTTEDTTINLADGIYGTAVISSGFIYSSSTNTGNITLIGSNPDNVILDGDDTYLILDFKPPTTGTLYLKNITLKNGKYSNYTQRYASAVYSSRYLDIENCNIIYNDVNHWNALFTAIYAYEILNLKDSNISYNNSIAVSASYIDSISNANISNNLYEGVKILGGREVNIKDSNFSNNTYAINSTSISRVVVNNSIFRNQSVYAIYSKNVVATNSIFINNLRGINLYGDASYNLIANSIFKNNKDYNIYSTGTSTSLISIRNNYIDEFKVYLNKENTEFKNNIFDNVDLGFEDEANANYTLTDSSGLIDRGTTNIEYISTQDYLGNNRVVGEGIDIGPYEYQTVIQSYSNMDYAEKLLKAIKPEYYADLISLINADKLATANSTKQSVIDSPSTFGIDTTTALTQVDVDALASGWSNISNQKVISEFNIFVNAKIVWVYKSNAWEAYSPIAATTTALTDAGITKLTSIPANSSLWIER